MHRIINRLFLLGVGLLLSAVGSGCCHTCNNHGSCLGYQDGCGADSGCDDSLSSARVSRLRRTRQRMGDTCSADVVECEECGRRGRRGADHGLCDDCSRASRRDRRVVRGRGGRGASAGFCDPCGGSCTGTCGAGASYGVPMSAGGGCCGSDMGGYPMSGEMPMGTYGAGMPVEGMSGGMTGGGGCSSCSGGSGASLPMGGMTYGNTTMLPGTVINGPIVSGGMVGGSTSGWVPAQMPTGTTGTSEPLPAPSAGTTVYSNPTAGSTAPSPGTFPTPAR
ncbi:MAG: hypothetical protein ACKOGA_25225 [Planctomycetaceae bacterium]